jgi:HAMP domain-containing protein
VNKVSRVGRSRANRPSWLSLDSVLRSPELDELCSKLGFAPPIWHRTDEFIARIESSIDETSLERERSCLLGQGALLLTDPEALRVVIGEAEDSFQRWAKRARNTQEFDEVIQQLRKIRELLVENKPVQASMILNLTGQMWCCRNWERLPEPLYERKMALDGVLRDVGLSRERPKLLALDGWPASFAAGSRSFSLANAAQAYVENDWMHTRWLTTLLARDMLFNLRSPMKAREEKCARWSVRLSVAGGVLGLFPTTRILGVVSFLVGVGIGVAAAVWVGSALPELDRIIGEVESGFYSGRVLADRLERLSPSRCDVPSVLTGVLRV